MSVRIDDAAGAAAHLGRRLEEEGVDYAIGGAVALATYGVVRMTRDVDLSAFLSEGAPGRLLEALERAGCLFERAAAERELADMGFMTGKVGRVTCDVFLMTVPGEVLARRRSLPIPGHGQRWMLSPEDLAVHKLVMLRSKDVGDLEGLFAAQGERLDLAYVRARLAALVPGDARREALLADLVARFATG